MSAEKGSLSKGSQDIVIVAGSGRLPVLLAEACAASGRSPLIAVVSGHGRSEDFSAYPQTSFRIGTTGKMIDTLKRQGFRHIVLAGGLSRPTWKDLRPDWKTLLFFMKNGLRRKGDDGLLRAAARILEKEGFTVYAPQTLLTALQVVPGPLGRIEPAQADHDAIELGFMAAGVLGAEDRGQAVIVKGDKVIDREDSSGTAALIARHKGVKGAILVKRSKPQQDKRLDMPTIGADTVTQAHAAGLKGIAIEAQAVYVLDRAEVVRLADQYGLFVYAGALS